MEFSKNPLVDYINRFYLLMSKYKKELIVSVAFCTGAIVLGTGYYFYKGGLQRRAQKDLSEALSVFNSPVYSPDLKKDDLDLNANFFTSEKEKWEKVSQVFEQGYQKNRGTGIAPMFLAYQAEALVNLGKNDSAVQILKTAIEKMPESGAKYFYTVKQALVSIDSNDKNLQDEGLELLKGLALDSKNIANPLALFYLGQYYWNSKNFDDAKNYWNQLILKYGQNSQKPSVWALEAKKHLKLITVK